MDFLTWNLVERRSFFISNSIWTWFLISFKMFQRNDRILPSLTSNSYIIFCICDIISELEIQVHDHLFSQPKFLP